MKICDHLENQKDCKSYRKSTHFDNCMYLRKKLDNHCDNPNCKCKEEKK